MITQIENDMKKEIATNLKKYWENRKIEKIGIVENLVYFICDGVIELLELALNENDIKQIQKQPIQNVVKKKANKVEKKANTIQKTREEKDIVNAELLGKIYNKSKGVDNYIDILEDICKIQGPNFIIDTLGENKATLDINKFSKSSREKSSGHKQLSNGCFIGTNNGSKIKKASLLKICNRLGITIKFL